MAVTEEVAEEMAATEEVEAAVEESAGSEEEEIVAFVDDMVDTDQVEAVTSEM